MKINYTIFLIFIHFLTLSCSKSTTEKSNKNETIKHIWHSYEFGTGVGNREEADFAIVELKEYFTLHNGVYKWKSLKIQEEIIIIGLGKNFIVTSTYENETRTFERREDLWEDTIDFTAFQKWDAQSQSLQNFIVVSVKTIKNNCTNYLLKWYKIENKNLVFFSNWSFYRQIVIIDTIKINNELKFLIVSQEEDGQNSSGDIYSFNITPQFNVWLFEKIPFSFSPSSVSVFSENENTFLLLSIPSINTIQVFRYSKMPCWQNENHFYLHQNISVIDLKSLSTFQVDYRWYLITASKQPYIYQLKENLLFYPLTNMTIENADNWFIVPIHNYREDKLLVSTFENRLAVASLSGNKIVQIVQNVSQSFCKNDFNCEKKANKVHIMQATSFPLNNYQIILMPTEDDSSLVMKLIFKLKLLPDVKVLKLNELLEAKKILEKNYLELNTNIEQLIREKKDFKPKIEKNFTDSNSQISQDEIKNTEKIEMLSSTKNWTDIYDTLQKLNDKVGSLVDDIQKFQNQQDKSLHDIKRSEEFTQQKNLIEGITFYGNVVINNLNVTALNGYKTDNLLKNLYRKDKKEKIGGIKIIKNLEAKHVSFNTVKNISNCDIIFTDDFLEGKSINVNGDVIFENSLNIFNDVKFMISDNTQNDSKTLIPNIQTNTFDTLHFEELKIIDEADILTSMNSQPLILPVHNVPLDIHYLNVSNQARIEYVNIQSDLKVGAINGLNFNNLTNQILLSDKIRKEGYKKAKINGVLSTDSLIVNNIIPKTKNLSNSEEKLPHTELNSTEEIDKKNFRSSQNNEKRKRKIYVYENLEVDGVIYTNKINHLDWSLINDIIRKDSKVVVNGKKVFKKPVTANKVNVLGTINGIHPESFLNTFTDQTIQFPQTFSKVEFKNVTLKGTWDGVNLKNFSESLMESWKWEFEDNLSLNNCSLITDILEVSESINNISLKTLNKNERQDEVIESIDFIKFIKASNVTINGSLITTQGINNINFTNLNEKRVSISTPQIINQNISLNNFKFDGAMNIVNLSGKDVSSIIEPEGDIKIIEKFFEGKTNKIKKLLVKGEIKTAHGINGYDLSKLADDGIRITENNVIDDTLIFEDTVFFDKLNVTGTINNIDIRQLEKNLVFESDNVFLRGEKNFTKLKVTKDAKIRSLNGHLIEDIITSKGHHIMKGPLKINGNVIVKGNITSNGAINDINIPNFLKKYSTQYNSYVVTEDLHLLKNDVNINKLLVGGKIQNINFEALMKKAVLKEGSFNIYGKKSFTGEVKFNKNIFVEEKINGLDVKKLINEIVMIDEPAKIEGTVTIDEAALSTIDVKEYFKSSLINNINTNDWLEESIPLNEENVSITGRMTFEKPEAVGNVEVNFINDQISSAVILLNEKQHIPINISFQNVNVTGDLNVGGFVNGKNLLEEFEDTVLVNGSQTIEGTLTFLENFTIDGNLLIDSVKGKEVNDLITLDTSQTITNVLDFQGSVVVNKDLKRLRLINNIDIIDWDNRSILLNREQEISGFWEIKGNIKAKNIEGEALIGSVSLFNVSKTVEENKKKAVEKKNETEVEYYNQCLKVEQLSEKYTKRPYVFNQFEVSQIIETPLVIESVIPFKISNSDYLVITFANNCLSTLYKWDKENSNFIKVRQINIGPVSKWLVLYHNGTTYLITSTMNTDMNCEEDFLPGNIWTFEADKYMHLYTTDSFFDAVQDNNSSQTFYTLEKGGTVFQWFIKNGSNISYKILTSLGQENYKFIDKRIFNELAVSNNREIKIIRSVDGKIILDSLLLHSSNIVPLPIGEKIFAAVVIKDKIVIYENLKEEKIFSIIHTFRANSVLWLDYGFEKQSFLIVSSHRKLIEVYEYKSVSGLVKRITLPLFSNKLQSISLPSKNKFQLTKFVIVMHKKKIVFLEAEMLGDFFETSDSLC